MPEIFDPVWAETAEEGQVVAPSEAVLTGGFQCGPVTPKVFNWLFQQIMTAINDLASVDAVPGARTINTVEGLTGGGNLTSDRTFKLAVQTLPEALGVANEDAILVYRPSEGGHRKITREDFVAGLGGGGGGTISGASNVGGAAGQVYAGLNGSIIRLRTIAGLDGVGVTVNGDVIEVSLADYGTSETVDSFDVAAHDFVISATNSPGDAVRVDARAAIVKLLSGIGQSNITIANVAPADQSFLWWHRDVNTLKAYDHGTGSWVALSPARYARHIVENAVASAPVRTSLADADKMLAVEASTGRALAITRENLATDIRATIPLHYLALM